MILENNKTAKVLKILGYMIIGAGSFGGIIFGAAGTHYFGSKIFWVASLVLTVTSCFSGILLIGLSEVVNLLHHIKNNTSQVSHPTNNPSGQNEQISGPTPSEALFKEDTEVVDTSVEWDITQEEYLQVRQLLLGLSEQIVSITPTPQKGLVAVKTTKSEVYLVEIRNNNTKVVSMADYPELYDWLEGILAQHQ